VRYLRLALDARDDMARREFYLGKSLAATADVVGIESLLNAIRIGAELHT
jgi:hypothetical protein